MPAKIVVEADNSNEVLKLLGAIAEAPAKEVEGRAKAYTGVTDLAEALKSTLPSDIDNIREDILTAFTNISELQKQVKALDIQLQGINLDDEVESNTESIRLIREEIKRLHQRIDSCGP